MSSAPLILSILWKLGVDWRYRSTTRWLSRAGIVVLGISCLWLRWVWIRRINRVEVCIYLRVMLSLTAVRIVVSLVLEDLAEWIEVFV